MSLFMLKLSQVCSIQITLWWLLTAFLKLLIQHSIPGSRFTILSQTWNHPFSLGSLFSSPHSIPSFLSFFDLAQFLETKIWAQRLWLLRRHSFQALSVDRVRKCIFKLQTQYLKVLLKLFSFHASQPQKSFFLTCLFYPIKHTKYFQNYTTIQLQMYSVT